MGLLSIFFIALGLSSDAFAVSVTNGMLIKDMRPSQALRFGIYFGGAQLVMTLIGFFFGTAFSSYIVFIDHWLAFGILSMIGGKMLYESLKGRSESEDTVNVLSFRHLMILAIATSIDALAVGVSFAFISADIGQAALIIGVVTFILCTYGALLGKKLGTMFRVYAERAGGIILILIGLKILIEHLMA